MGTNHHLSGRKFRDEARPRGGLLRCREFLMKDLYTFDATHDLAQRTYNEVKTAYCRIFDRIGLQYAIVRPSQLDQHLSLLIRGQSGRSRHGQHWRICVPRVSLYIQRCVCSFRDPGSC